MKAAIVLTSLEIGGAEKMVLDLISHLKEKIRIRLYIIRKNFGTDYDIRAEQMGIPVIYLNCASKITSLFAARKLSSLLSEFHPDIIHTHLKAASYVLYYALKHHDFRWIHTVHTLAAIDTKPIRRLFFRKLYEERKIELVAVSETVRESLIRLYQNPSVTVIFNGIDPHQYNRNPTKHFESTILHVGRFVKVKNHRYLLREFAKLHQLRPGMRLILVGDGPLFRRMKEFADELQISQAVTFTGRTDKVPEYLEQSDIFVLPSFYEGLPLSLLEAMASGLIVLSAPCGSEVIRHRVNGFLFRLEEDALYRLLIEIIQSMESFDTIRENAIRTAEQFSLEAMSSRYLELYEGKKHD